MILLLAWHDFLLLVKDKKTMMVLIMMPIILMTILGYSLSQSFESGFLKEPVKIGIVKLYEKNTPEDNWFGALSSSIPKETALKLTKMAQEIDLETIFFEEFLNNPDVKEIMTYIVMDEATAKEALHRGSVLGILYLPKDFIKDLSMSLMLPVRNQTEPKLVLSRENGIKSTIVKSIFEGFFQDLNRRITVKQTLNEALALNTNTGPDYEALGREMKHMMEMDFNAASSIEGLGVPGISSIGSIAYYAAALMSMFLLFTAGQGGRMFLEEKEQFTMQRQLMSGISIWHMLISKWITLVAIALTQTALMILFSATVLNVAWGSLLQVLFIACFSSFAVAGMGVFVGVVTYKLEDFKLANMMEALIIQIMAFFGGSFIPLAGLPGFVETMSYLTINGLTLKALLRTMQGFGLESFALNLYVLLGIMVLFVGGAARMLRKDRWANT